MTSFQLDRESVLAFCRASGADLAGIATPQRLADAPPGHRPEALLTEARSVVVLACATAATTDVKVYTACRNTMIDKMNELASGLARWLEERGYRAVVADADGGAYDPAENGRFFGPLSLKHAAQAAGLGRIGRNQLLTNDRFGNLLWLSAVVTTLPLAPDPLAIYPVCIEGCNLCIDNCATGVLSGGLLNQRACFQHAYQNPGPDLRIECWKCRSICPHSTGLPSPSEPS